MDEAKPQVAQLDFDGGVLCLDFINTVDWRTGSEPVEYLNTYTDLVAWGKHAGILDADAYQRLLAQGAHQPDAGEAVWAQAIRLREATYHIFVAIERGEMAAADDLETLNEVLNRAMAQAQVMQTAEAAFTWGWQRFDESLEGVLWPIVRSAADLLTSPDLQRVRQCLGEGCGWLFLDTSKNHSRRWCNMEGCGNRAKAKRHYRRHSPAKANAEKESSENP